MPPRRSARRRTRRVPAWRLRCLSRPALTALTVALLVLGSAGVASAAAEDELAARHAPVLRLVEQQEECGPGEPYAPSDVDAFLGEDTVALRGPWTTNDLVEIAPTADDLAAGRYEYHLDFPGNPLEPGCDYERWARIVTEQSTPTTYARVTMQDGRPDRVAVQYWFFYPFNDYNNKHEGDWEMVQVLFDAESPEEALREDPLEVGYSQHEGGERAEWDDPKLELVGGARPVVHVAAGSHANYYEEALFLGRSGEQGVGCDDTRGPTTEVRPAVRVVPRDPAETVQSFPWLGFEGRWGERQEAFYNGPTGPNMKAHWTEPVTWAEEKGRDNSYAVPVGGLLGTETTDFFCGAVEAGSDLVRNLVAQPGPALVVIGTVLALLVVAAVRTTWRPTAPLRVPRRRAWGQMLTASWRMFVSRPGLFFGLGLPTVLVALAVSALQSSLVRAPEVAGVAPGGEAGGWRVGLAAVLSLGLTLAGVAFVQATCARALAEIDAGHEVGIGSTYRAALGSVRAVLGAAIIATVVVSLLGLSVFLAPVAVWLTVRWGLVVPIAALERHSPVGALRRSAALVRYRPWTVAALLLATGLLVVVAGPVLGTLLILATSAPLELINVFTGITYAAMVPFTGLALTYAYHDARVREQLAGPQAAPRDLPAEV